MYSTDEFTTDIQTEIFNQLFIKLKITWLKQIPIREIINKF